MLFTTHSAVRSARPVVGILAALAIASLTACGGSPDGSGDGAGEGAAVSSGESPRANAPKTEWVEDLAVQEGEAPAAADDVVGEPDDRGEDPTAEDPGAMPTGSASADGTGESASALSTTTGTTFQFTYYWVAQRPSSDPNQVTIRDCAGSFLSYASYAWRDQVRMEMTGRFTKSDGTSVVFNDAGGCWKKMTSYYNWGMGVSSPVTGSSYKLRPFRSIAVDNDVLRIGKWYYVKQLDGVTMPSPVSGMVHDGCVRAVDEGYGIHDRHIDFFAGLKSAYTKLAGGTSSIAGRTSVTVYDGAVKCATHIANGY